MENSLLDLLRERRVDRLIEDAEFIREWPDAAERIDAAARHIRMAMLACALGKGDSRNPRINSHTSISEAELHQILETLNFAVELPPPSAPDPWQTLAD